MDKEDLKKISEKLIKVEKVTLTFVAKPIINILFFKLLIPIKVYNIEPLKGKSFVLCPNHLSEKDKFYFWARFNNNCSIAKKEFFQTDTFFKKVRAHVFRLMDAIPVDREKPSPSTFREMNKFFERNKENGKNPICIIYPQGTISNFLYHQNEDTIQPGTFNFAEKMNVPIVPVYIEQFRFFKQSVVVYGNPIQVNTKDENGKRDKVKELYYCKLWLEEMNRLHKEAERLAGRPMRQPIYWKEHHREADEKALRRRLEREEKAAEFERIEDEKVKVQKLGMKKNKEKLSLNTAR